MGDSVVLKPVEREKIQAWVAAYGTPQQVALRCRIVLGVAEGEAEAAIARRLSVNRNTVILWRKRFVEQGLDGLWEIAAGRGLPDG
jgi:transposase